MKKMGQLPAWKQFYKLAVSHAQNRAALPDRKSLDRQKISIQTTYTAEQFAWNAAALNRWPMVI